MKNRLHIHVRLAVTIAAVTAVTSRAIATTLTVVSPIAGQACTAGTTVTIAWLATEPNGYVDIELLRNGASFTSIGYVPMADGWMDWEICSIIGDSGNNAVHIVGYDAAGNMVQASSGVFSISGSAVQPTFALTWPTAGASWSAGTWNNITWTSTNPAGCVYVDLYKGGQLYREIGYAPMADGKFGWAPCMAIGAGTDYTIRLSMDGCGSAPTATSPAFSITIPGQWLPPSISIISPTGSDAWTAGSTQPIQWTDTTGGPASIVLLKGGQWYGFIDLAMATPDVFGWGIACDMPTGTDYAIRIAGCDDCGGVVSALSPVLSIRQRADFDWDGDADLADFESFACCFNGPNRPANACGVPCSPSDFDGDGDVDLVDFLTFQAAFNGPNQPPRCN